MKKPMLLYSAGRSATVRLLPGDPNAGAKKTRWEMNAQGVMEAWGVTPDEDGLLVQFDAYDLAVYRELAVRLENQNAA